MNEPLSIDVSRAVYSDEAAWNTYVEQHPSATPYHRFDWMKAVENSYKQTIAGLLARNSNGEVLGVLPMVDFSVPLISNRLVSLPYCDLGFIIADNKHVEKQLLDSAISLAQRTGAKATQIRAISKETQEAQTLDGKKVRMMLSLPDTSDELMASFKSKLRSQVRKAEKNGLTFKTRSSLQLIDDFYYVYSTNMRDLGSPAHAKKWFKAVIAAYKTNALISVVYTDRQPIGAGIVLKNGSSACIPWASTIQAFNKLAPNMLLYWSVLSHCADNHIQHFDFGRSTFNEGTFKFKKQWGAEPELLEWQTFDSKGSLLPEHSSGQKGALRSGIESAWRKLPTSLATQLGAFLRPYISL
ncbi:FemAB family PEP-CTERM system-associated protein [Alteromonas sediminis]|uniref:FemAB family PEP-CTERM system-associated protein n=1 Tax=Alteromonas sediminis TaxID=2259342 RepID=A0A3N5XYM9_9ALTE|nr:FemAB family XrtA/PEP-CTERM system-associated protein [Alteromonas sediminis]RPJ65720.1 FemAB family PEP-CTERM system-associated protein [Alteromonas sediminis]